jgi:transposase
MLLTKHSKMSEQRIRDRLQLLIECGVTDNRKLTKITGAGLTTVKRVKALLKSGHGVQRKPGSGRKEKLQTRDKQRVAALAKERPKWSRLQLAEEAAKRGSPRVSRWTIGRYLKKANWVKVVPTAKPMLTVKQKATRLAWCLENKDTDWDTVVFSDEAKFQQHTNKTPLWTNKARKRFKRMPKNSQKINVWGAISIRGTSTLALFGHNVNSEVYCAILDEHLESIDVLSPDGYTFQQDNAPPHTSKFTKAWMADHKIKVISWPANSPDLNPIENVWGLIKRKLGLEDPMKTGEWKSKIEDIWLHLGHDYLESLIRSMPKRIEMCIAAGGDHINY